jgi:hypothetical protein
MIVRVRIPPRIRRMIITRAMDVMVVGIRLFRRERRRIIGCATAYKGGAGDGAGEHEPDGARTFHGGSGNEWVSTHNRGGDDDADAKDDRSADNGGGDIFVFDDFLVEVAWCADVKNLVAQDGEHHAGESEQRGQPERLGEAFGMPAFGTRIDSSVECRRREQDKGGKEKAEDAFHGDDGLALMLVRRKNYRSEEPWTRGTMGTVL